MSGGKGTSGGGSGERTQRSEWNERSVSQEGSSLGEGKNNSCLAGGYLVMMVYVLVAFLLFGSSVVFSSRSPYFAIFGVLIQAISFSLLFCLFGYPMFGLLTVLIYVGGMLIIFLFSTVLSAERYPDSGWGELLLVTVSL